jgi:glutathione S-transferase
MPDYDLYYWQLPFRGQFIRALLAFAGKRWNEYADADIAKVMSADVADQAVPFMGPPMLVDRRSGAAIAEMPAIAMYLGETLRLLPASALDRALTLKVVADANDVIDELTRDGGRDMWTPARWHEFKPRLGRWMRIFEETGRRHGLTPDAGFLLGGRRAGVADIVAATLWHTAADRFPVIGELLAQNASACAGLARRLYAQPSLANLAAVTRQQFGDGYCGGEIEASMRRVIK